MFDLQIKHFQLRFCITNKCLIVLTPQVAHDRYSFGRKYFVFQPGQKRESRQQSGQRSSTRLKRVNDELLRVCELLVGLSFFCHSGAKISGLAVNKPLLKMLPDGSENSQLTSAWAIVFFGTIRGW